MDVFLWAMLLMKYRTNFSPKSLKVVMDLSGSKENQDLTAFIRVTGKSFAHDSIVGSLDGHAYAKHL